MCYIYICCVQEVLRGWQGGTRGAQYGRTPGWGRLGGRSFASCGCHCARLHGGAVQWVCFHTHTACGRAVYAVMPALCCHFRLQGGLAVRLQGVLEVLPPVFRVGWRCRHPSSGCAVHVATVFRVGCNRSPTCTCVRARHHRTPAATHRTHTRTYTTSVHQSTLPVVMLHLVSLCFPLQNMPVIPCIRVLRSTM